MDKYLALITNRSHIVHAHNVIKHLEKDIEIPEHLLADLRLVIERIEEKLASI